MFNIKKIRKELHQIPELAHEEFKTQSYLLSKLQQYPSLELYEFKPTGILAAYNNGSGDYLLFRADMDALALKEETGCEYCSQHPGIMHACGHDMHMAILLGLIDLVISENLALNLLFVFQPAEEGKGGAERILKDDIWNEYIISNAYALHVTPALKPGIISSRPGNFFAATAEFDVQVTGKSSHIALPEEGNNALKAGVELYQCIQQLPKVVKSDEHFICDIGVLKSGNVRNAVPAECLLSGTIRAETQNDVKALEETVAKICETVSFAYNITIKSEILVEYKEVYNNETLLEELKEAASRQNVTFLPAEKTMAGEDFGYMTSRWKGLLFWLGAGGEVYYPLHNEHFLPDENALEVGVKIFRELIKLRKGI